jgi:hypothetical protein
MDSRFSVDSEGMPFVRSGFPVVDQVLTYERKHLGEVVDAIRDVRDGRRSKWHYGYHSGGFELDRHGALVYSDWDSSTDELPLDYLEDLIQRFLAFRPVRPPSQRRHGPR